MINRWVLIPITLLAALQVLPDGYVRAPELFGTATYYGTQQTAIISNDWVTFVALDGQLYQVAGESIHDIQGSVPYTSVGNRWLIDFRGHPRKMCFAATTQLLKCK